MDGAYPGFTKSFSPATVNVGQTSVLTFTIVSGSGASNLAFLDTLPAGMLVATPASAIEQLDGVRARRSRQLRQDTVARGGGTKLAFAEGVVGLSPGFQTFLLVANTSATQALSLQATYIREDGTAVVKNYAVPIATSATIRVNAEVPELSDQAFGVVLTATNGVPFVAEESVYWNGFTGGATTVGTPIP